jgi:quercetin dioxygenase-like cupin family protein
MSSASTQLLRKENSTMLKPFLAGVLLFSAPAGAFCADAGAIAARESLIVHPSGGLHLEAAPGLPEGATQALLRTDPATGGIERLVLFPAGTHIGAHWHTAAECVVVLEGSARLKVGDTTTELGPGSYAWIPARTIHEAWIGEGGAGIFQRYTATPDRRAPEELEGN